MGESLYHQFMLHDITQNPQYYDTLFILLHQIQNLGIIKPNYN